MPQVLFKTRPAMTSLIKLVVKQVLLTTVKKLQNKLVLVSVTKIIKIATIFN
jgi:hypothetical protein